MSQFRLHLVHSRCSLHAPAAFSLTLTASAPAYVRFSLPADHSLFHVCSGWGATPSSPLHPTRSGGTETSFPRPSAWPAVCQPSWETMRKAGSPTTLGGYLGGRCGKDFFCVIGRGFYSNGVR